VTGGDPFGRPGGVRYAQGAELTAERRQFREGIRFEAGERRHVQQIESGRHRPGQENPATDHPYLLGHPVERARDRGAQRREHRLPRRVPRRDRDAGDRVRRAVGEPGDPRPAGLALDVGRHRRLHVVRLPHLVAPAPRPGQESIMLARRPLPCRPLPCRKSGPLLRRQITADRPVQRRQRRCVCGRRLPGSTQDQSAVDRPHVPLPQRQRSTDLGRDREPCIDPGACAVPARAGARAVRTRRPTVVSPACPSGRRAR
jgi:hypothetical protein